MSEHLKAKRQLPFIEENSFSLNFEDKFRRFGFTALLIIILAALAGFFSSGYFSEQHQSNENNSLLVEYDKYGRLMKDFTLSVTIAEQPAATHTLRLSNDFLQDFQVENVVPQPDRMYSSNNTLYLEYRASPLKQNLTTRLSLKPLTPGIVRTTISANDLPETAISQFIYP